MRGRAVGVMAIAVAASGACGESRRPIGDECIRDEDCLSNVCAARSCTFAPTLVVGTTATAPEEEPRIPDAAVPDAS